MNTGSQYGYFVIADISGYTSYLAEVELQHAQGLLAELLELVVERFKTVLTVSRLEGDAVFAYTPENRLPRGETLLELIEATYLAFRERQAAFRRNSCECDACQSLPTLDLKFIIHFGQYTIQNVSDFQELVGTDVNLAHRLLKNHVSEAVGWRAYVLFSEPAVAQMSISPQGLFEQTEVYSHIRPVKTFSLDLQTHYRQIIEGRRVSVGVDEADLVISQEYDLPPHEVWSWLNDPGRRLQWEGFTNIQSSARRGVGVSNECTHSRGASTETILDWRPFDYYTALFRHRVAGWQAASLGILVTCQLVPTAAGGTSLEIRIKAQLSLPEWLERRLAKPFLQLRQTRQQYEKLAQVVMSGPACQWPGSQATPVNHAPQYTA